MTDIFKSIEWRLRYFELSLERSTFQALFGQAEGNVVWQKFKHGQYALIPLMLQLQPIQKKKLYHFLKRTLLHKDFYQSLNDEIPYI